MKSESGDNKSVEKWSESEWSYMVQCFRKNSKSAVCTGLDTGKCSANLGIGKIFPAALQRVNTRAGAARQWILVRISLWQEVKLVLHKLLHPPRFSRGVQEGTRNLEFKKFPNWDLFDPVVQAPTVCSACKQFHCDFIFSFCPFNQMLLARESLSSILLRKWHFTKHLRRYFTESSNHCSEPIGHNA